jgi:hypothetical protein
MADFHRVTVDDERFIRGPARVLIAGYTVAAPTGIADIINLSTYDAQSGWTDLGATKGGVTVTVNNTEEEFDIDQILGAIKTEPVNWEASVSTQLAEMNLERLQVAWEGGDITTVSSGQADPFDEMGFGQAEHYTLRRLAVLYKRPTDKIRAFVFWKVGRSPQESTVVFNKTGEQQSVAVRFRAFAETSLSEKKRFFVIRDQANE